MPNYLPLRDDRGYLIGVRELSQAEFLEHQEAFEERKRLAKENEEREARERTEANFSQQQAERKRRDARNAKRRLAARILRESIK